MSVSPHRKPEPVTRQQILGMVERIVSRFDPERIILFGSRARRECPTDTVCFHAQQCVEKYVKAILVAVGAEFPRTHDVEMLIALMPQSARPTLTLA